MSLLMPWFLVVFKKGEAQLPVYKQRQPVPVNQSTLNYRENRNNLFLLHDFTKTGAKIGCFRFLCNFKLVGWLVMMWPSCTSTYTKTCNLCYLCNSQSWKTWKHCSKIRSTSLALPCGGKKAAKLAKTAASKTS